MSTHLQVAHCLVGGALLAVAVDEVDQARAAHIYPPLIEHFIGQANTKFSKEVTGVSKVALNYLLRHDWPGNARELRNVVNFGVMMAQRDVIWIEDLAWKMRDGRIEPTMGTEDEDLSLDAVERRHVKRVLLITNGNKRRACDLLGISRPTLNRMLRRWEAEAGGNTAPGKAEAANLPDGDAAQRDTKNASPADGAGSPSE